MTFAYQWRRCNQSDWWSWWRWSCENIDGATGPAYALVSDDLSSSIRLRVTASNDAGSRTAKSELTAPVTEATPPTDTTTTPTTTTPTTTTPTTTTPTTTTPTTTTPTTTTPTTTTPTPTPVYFGTLPAGSPLPRSDSYCASAVASNPWEPRPDNYTTNHTVGDGSYTWATENYWTKWRDKRALVDGNFTGTTTEIISWAACKWGIDEDLIRADAVQESHWDQSVLGDVCGPVGQASYGLMQIKNENCSGTLIHGGYPDTQQSTALDVDWFAAHIRSCYDGDFYDGGSWLYGGQTVNQIAASKGWDYVLWGCIGYHFSGGWYDAGAVDYISKVQTWLATKAWLSY